MDITMSTIATKYTLSCSVVIMVIVVVFSPWILHAELVNISKYVQPLGSYGKQKLIVFIPIEMRFIQIMVSHLLYLHLLLQ